MAVPAEKESRSGRALPWGITPAGLAAIAAILLSIIGLFGAATVPLAAIAAIFLGAALLMNVASFGRSSRYADAITDIDIEETTAFSFNALAGLAGVVLGILSLIGMSPQILLPSAAITYGCAMLLESASAGSAEESMYASSGINLLSGVAAVVLGILALSGYSPAVLTFVAFLVAGCTGLLTGSGLVQRTSDAIIRKF